jgi:hypothetical protein
MFVEVEWQIKIVYALLVVGGITCWVGVALYQTVKYREYYLHASLKKHSWLDRQAYAAALFLCYLCNMPSYLLGEPKANGSSCYCSFIAPIRLTSDTALTATVVLHAYDLSLIPSIPIRSLW